MICKDLMNIPQIRNGMKLVAGEKGLWRSIRWIYYADCMQCLKDEVDLLDLIHGRELVIVTDETLTDDDEKIIQMIRVMMQKDIAGFVINEGQISQAVIDYCNEVSLPLYELSVKLYLVDVSQTICRILFEEEDSINLRSRLFSSILYEEDIDTADLLLQARHLDLDLSGRNKIVIIRLCSREEDSEAAFIQAAKPGESAQTIRSSIETAFRVHGLQIRMSLQQGRDMIFLLPAQMTDCSLLKDTLSNIIHMLQKHYGWMARAGVGSGYDYLTDLRESFHEAESALKIAEFAPNADRIYFYEDLGIYALIPQIKNEKVLDNFIERHIGRLIDADRLQEGDLCGTLEAYFENDCNANAAANALFIHRNTMRYRMEKIYKILEIDNMDFSVSFNLKLAFAIKKYRDSKDR